MNRRAFLLRAAALTGAVALPRGAWGKTIAEEPLQEPAWMYSRAKATGPIKGSPTLGDLVAHGAGDGREFGYDAPLWAHEGTHVINGKLAYPWPNDPYQALYCLNDRVCFLPHPRPVTLGQIADYVPLELRGRIYNLYLVQQRQNPGGGMIGHENRPAYPLDEWVSYANGAQVSLELRERSSDYQFTIEMGVYCLAVCVAVEAAVRARRLRYDQRQLRNWVAWHWERCMKLWDAASRQSGLLMFDTAGYYNRLAKGTGQNLVALRDWCRWYFGKDWTGKVLRF